MHKSILVLFVTAIFVLTVGYIVVKDRKVLVEQKSASYEYEQEAEEKNNNLEELSDISVDNDIKEYIKNSEQNKQNTDEDKETLQKSQESNLEDIFGKIIIEKINLSANVKEGCSEEILNNYVGHIEGTATYNGNIGLAAHNRGEHASYFARLKELEIGDKIIFKKGLETREYKVASIKEILDTDWGMLENTNENKITLITCVNNKINVRLCVQAVEI